MQGNPDVIACLQQALTMEATLNEQYRLNERSLKFLGLKPFKVKFFTFGCDTSDRRREILDRIYFLGAMPTYGQIGTPTDQGSVTAVFQDALTRETALVAAFNNWAIVAMNAKDDNTRNQFEHWIKWHEDDHIAWLEKQLRLIGAIGEASYIAEKM